MGSGSSSQGNHSVHMFGHAHISILKWAMAYAASPRTWNGPYHRSGFIDFDVAAYKKLTTRHITPSLIPKSSTHTQTHPHVQVALA
ncbi:hypothetical protein CSHISOI_10501 [Colletotrichum shisoi]|uniref:Uncharacterized protein n=1 Tax=Colletotrichum shisoi TaxID=2078593 RepID=A0A5Q4BDA9_9PEZI|nr:hypothetical protein CSHISOI_10501 [Colletotrichum shisoi]